MAPIANPAESRILPAKPVVPPLVAGDRLTRAEFERRYQAMSHSRKAELIEGVVYVPSPVSVDRHASPHFDLVAWIGFYRAYTPGVQGAAECTVRLDVDNEPKPDGLLRIKPSHGGQSRTSPDDYLEAAPELVAEVANSSTSYDLHQKKEVYRRNGVREYIVWRILDEALDWFILRESLFVPLAPDAAGLLWSETFPGLVLDPTALLRGDLARVFAVLQEGLKTPEHAAFVERLAAAGRSAPA